MSNAGFILDELSATCDGSHFHIPLVNGRAAKAAVYPEELCKAICRGYIKQRKFEAEDVKHLMNVTAEMKMPERPEEEEDDIPEQLWAWDDVNDKALDAGMVKQARQDEMNYINLKNVWSKVSKQQALKLGYKIVDTRWIDTDKGDRTNPVYRSRLVGKEFNTGQEDGLFASTPPLEALRWLVSEAATIRRGHRMGSKVALISDVSRAFFEAPARRKVAVILPTEALEGRRPRRTLSAS